MNNKPSAPPFPSSSSDSIEMKVVVDHSMLNLDQSNPTEKKLPRIIRKSSERPMLLLLFVTMLVLLLFGYGLYHITSHSHFLLNGNDPRMFLGFFGLVSLVLLAFITAGELSVRFCPYVIE